MTGGGASIVAVRTLHKYSNYFLFSVVSIWFSSHSILMCAFDCNHACLFTETVSMKDKSYAVVKITA